ncbi:MAG: DEAD/DEAH box helicase [Candidatus Binatia bacterium]
MSHRVDKSEIPFHPQFHPLIWRWFSERFAKPTAPQENGWKHIAEGRDTLIAAPTGSGKTLAAFLWSIDGLIQRALAGTLEDKTSVVYISPLKALGNDIEKNLREPLAGIMRLAEGEGLNLPEIRVAVRSGDTPTRERQLMVRYPPHILITTPESLYILLTAERSRQILRSAETAIVDEIHAVAGDKRGSHLALSLERLDALAERPLQRIGLSATQKPIEEIARLLLGTGRIRPDGVPECAIVDVGHKRDLDLSIELPDQELGPIAQHSIWAEIYDRITERVKAHRTSLVFVNTRRLVERVAHQLTGRLGEGKVGAHHGSLSRKNRLEVEERLKSGDLAVVVATASLELGIDIGHVDLVCHIGSPRTLATLLQRVGRSGHWLGATPKGVFYPLTRDDLLQCVAAIRAVRDGELDRVIIPEKAVDILAQQMVATAASVTATAKPGSPESDKVGSGIGEKELFRLVSKAYPYRNLTKQEFDQVLQILSEGIANRRGRRSAYIHHDRVHGRLRARRGARLTAITNGGAIPDTADYEVIEAPDETFIGKVNEDFAIESLAGDIFLLGNKSWRIRRVSSGKVWVEDAQGAPPTIPFWLGEAPARTLELSIALSELRRQVASRLPDGPFAERWLVEETGVPEAAAEQIVSYIRDTHSILGHVPTTGCIVAERFFDEAGGMQLVLHAPLGGRINRAWGLVLRKRFCVTFDCEVQAAATDDGIVLSLGEQHSFPLKEVFSWVHPARLEKDLIQAALVSPMFINRWRWNATRALALLRYSGGKKVPMAIQRIRAEDLLAAVFPEQVMCQDNRVGPIELPDHPLVSETMKDCLHEAMDLDGLREILAKIGRDEIATVAVETPAPSPMAHEILNANPYAFLDDAPLEERRARAVSLRRIDPDLARGIGALNPDAIEEVRGQAWPDLRDADELHDFLLGVCLLPIEQAQFWSALAEQLIQTGRATVTNWCPNGEAGERQGYVAAERLGLVRAVFPEMRLTPQIVDPLHGESSIPSADEAMCKIVQGWMEVIGPITARSLADKAGLSVEQVERGLLTLEMTGVVLRGQFTSQRDSETEVEWCERGLLARIHRLTLGRLRREIEAVTAADFINFLLSWQHVQPMAQLRGREGVMQVISQLQGLELPAPAWEQHVLPARVSDYNPEDLENLCLAGIVAWARLRSDIAPPGDEGEDNNTRTKTKRLKTPRRVAPIAFILRDDLSTFVEPVNTPWDGIEELSDAARDVGRYLEQRGASFLADIARGTGLLKTKTEEALWELVARGLVTGDGIAGLRVLLAPEVKRRPKRRRLRLISGGRTAERLMPVGRWSLWRAEARDSGSANTERANELLARQLLCRYGVVFRELLTRETRVPPWRTLLEIYRRLEARGEIRGGRFVNGFVGEQYALPEAVDLLRALRRSHAEPSPVIISCSDPLNFVGILTPGSRVSPYSKQVIAYSDGVPVEIGPLGAVRSRLQQA